MITEISRNRKYVCDIRYDALMNEHDPFAFARWLQKQMDDRGMKGVDLTRLTGKGSGTISGWLSAGVVPSPRSLRVIADALVLPRADVLAAAGHKESAQRTGVTPTFDATPTGSTAGDPEERLLRAKSLLAAGLIDPDDYEKVKTRILATL